MNVPTVVSTIAIVISLASAVIANSITPRNEMEVATAYVCGLLAGRNVEPEPIKECGMIKQLAENRGLSR